MLAARRGTHPARIRIAPPGPKRVVVQRFTVEEELTDELALAIQEGGWIRDTLQNSSTIDTSERRERGFEAFHLLKGPL